MPLLNDRYRLDESLGGGGMGTVYRGYDILLQRPVAVKVLTISGIGAVTRERMLREAQAAARLNHPNIVAIYDAGEANIPGIEVAGNRKSSADTLAGDKNPFIVMELVAGKSLHELSPGAWQEVLPLIKQVCSALEHAHANGIVHRDLKPENILVTPDGQAKLTDFGLARSLASRLSVEGAISGTVFYLAPELVMTGLSGPGSSVTYDGRADLYALGVILFELLAGRLPFTGDDPLIVVSQHLHAPPVPPRTYNPDIPQALEALTLKLLAKNPAERFASAAEVRQALEAIEAATAGLAAGDLVPGGSPEHLEAGAGDGSAVALLDLLARGRLVGRRDELEQLRDLWRRVQQGRSYLALISGEPGVGKTRLARELIVYAQLSGAIILHGGCYEYEAATPYLPFVEALREWVHTQPAATLTRALGPLAPELARLAPEIEAKLGPQPPNPTLPPNEERLRLFDHVARFFHDLANEHGLLLFIDDLHWADQGTLALLLYLLRSLHNERLLVLSAYREVELDRSHPFAAALVEWNRERLVLRLPLGRLSEVEVGELLAALFGLHSASSEFTRAIFRETEGNPFFVEEVVKALIEQGQIYREAGRWQRQEIAQLTIPQSIKEAIGRRLDRLLPACTEMLHAAAVLGKRFTFPELSTITSLPEDDLLDRLDEAVRARLIQSEGGEVFSFTHDKIREVLYEELNPIRRRRLNQKAGDGLERLYTTDLDRHAQDLAFHFIESGDLEKGLRYALQAARRAAGLYAFDEAINYYRRAADCAESLNLSTDLAEIYTSLGHACYNHGLLIAAAEAYQRALALPGDPHRHAALRSMVGKAYMFVGDDRGLPFLEQAQAELDPETQADELANNLAAIGRYHHYRAEWDQAAGYLEDALRIAEPLDNPATLVGIYTNLAGVEQQRYRLQQSDAWCRRSIAMGESKGFPKAEAIGYEFLAENAFIAGRWRDCLAYAKRDIEISSRNGSLDRVGWGEAAMAFANLGLGDLPAALASANQALALAEQIEENRLATFARTVRVPIQFMLGEDEAAQADLETNLAICNASSQRQLWIWTLNTQAFWFAERGEWQLLLDLMDQFQARLGLHPWMGELQALLGLGRLEEATRLAVENGDHPYPEHTPHNEARACHLGGLVKMTTGNLEEAKVLFNRAAIIFEEQESRLDLARLLAARARLHEASGSPAEALADRQRADGLLSACHARPGLGAIRWWP